MLQAHHLLKAHLMYHKVCCSCVCVVGGGLQTHIKREDGCGSVVAQIQQFYRDVQSRREAEFGPDKLDLETSSIPGGPLYMYIHVCVNCYCRMVFIPIPTFISIPLLGMRLDSMVSDCWQTCEVSCRDLRRGELGLHVAVKCTNCMLHIKLA